MGGLTAKGQEWKEMPGSSHCLILRACGAWARLVAVVVLGTERTVLHLPVFWMCGRREITGQERGLDLRFGHLER